MKKIITVLFILLIGCTKPETVAKVEYQKLVDSISILNQQHQKSIALIGAMQDSIIELKQQPLMTADQFIQLYKYDRLLKYYRICEKNPTQWKYYKGWSIRVFNQ